MPQVAAGLSSTATWISGPVEISLFGILLLFAALAVIVSRSLFVFGIALFVCGLAAAAPGLAQTIYTAFGGGGGGAGG